jgi:hypothetical protein
MLALVTLLGWLFHPGTTAFGVPTGETMRAIGESLRQAGLDINEMAPPAEATDALTLLSVLGVFFVAVFVDVLVFRLRRPVTAGLPLLALFMIPTALTDKPNVFVFICAAIGYLCLLVAEGRDRARAWGRRLSGIDKLDEVGDVSHVARVGRRIGTAAVGLAIAVPVALPSVGDGVFSGTGGPFGHGDGPSRVVVISPIVEIRSQLRQKFEVDLFTVRPLQGENGYTRLTSLDEFNGNEWRLVEQEADDDNKVGKNSPIPQPREHERIQTSTRTFDVSVGPLAVQWLPLPYSPRIVDVKGDWKYEPATMSVFTARNKKTSKDVSFQVTSVVPEPTEQQLRDSAGAEIPRSIQRYLELPGRPANPVVKRALEQVTGKFDNPYDKAYALQQWFHSTGGFHYNLDAPAGTGDDALADFLENKEGYCEQFAAAMAYMARLDHIPARVAVGFTRGTQAPDGSWVVTNRDAHAWPELYFPGAGWVRFEPTPRNDDQEIAPPYARPSVSIPSNDPKFTDGPTPSASASATATPSSTNGPDRRPEDEDLGPDANGSSGGGPVGRALRTLALGVLAVALLLSVPSLVGWAGRRRRRSRASDDAGRTHAAWDALADAAEDAGFPMRPSESPRAAARRLVTASGLYGTVADEVGRLATAEERARYARTAPAVDGLDAAARSVRKALLASLPAWRRVRALVVPASSTRRIREAYGSLIERLDRSRTAIRTRAGALVRSVVRRGPAAGRAG